MSFIKLTWQCVFAPRLFKIYRGGANPIGDQNNYYKGNSLERWSDTIIHTVEILWKYGLYTTPIFAIYFMTRGLPTIEQTKTLTQALFGVLFVSYIIRTCGRIINPEYVEFMNVLYSPTQDQKKYLDAIRKYDFEYHAWPINFTVQSKVRYTTFEMLRQNPFNSTANSHLPAFQRIPIQILGYLATHTFAMSLIYPGTSHIIQSFLGNHLYDGRSQLVEEFNGRRAKIETADGNEIDTMFVDQRNYNFKGRTLVICCEGNCGFYEVGIMMSAIKGGYSTLGWNHPGFASSTGFPYPQQEHNAIDGVIQYAIHQLGFDIHDIVLYGWSIGGYTATWGAVHYPDIKCLVLDATFDDLMQLAKKAMPESWAPLVKEVILTYANLDIAALITQYSGPIYLIRRTQDEVICINEGQLSSNRGNHLVVKMITHRHPELNNTHNTNILTQHIGLEEKERKKIELSTNDEDLKLCLNKINLYFGDYKSSHCIPLPEQMLAAVLDKYDNND